MTGLVRKILRIFFSPSSHNFTRTGISLPLPNSCSFVAHGELTSFIMDERAYKYIFEVKGASGTKCCLLCKNILTTPVKNHPYFKHHSEARPEDFDRHSNTSIYEMAQGLAEHAGHPRQLHELQQLYGLNYAPNGLLYDKYLQPYVRPADTTYFDWMHCLVASGGVAQYHINVFCLELTRQGIRLEQLDDFKSLIIWPSARKRELTPTFFASRIVKQDSAHLRGFGSEVLQALPVLLLFSERVLIPSQRMLEHVECLEYLASL